MFPSFFLQKEGNAPHSISFRKQSLICNRNQWKFVKISSLLFLHSVIHFAKWIVFRSRVQYINTYRYL